MLSSTVTLNNGTSMPLFGTGTTHNDGGISEASLTLALNLGVSLVDTASRYQTESTVATAIKKSDRDRKDIFITSKLWPGDVQEIGDVQRAFEQSLEKLNTDAIDLYLIHWPGVKIRDISKGRLFDPQQSRQLIWRQMQDLYRSGRCRAIGVSNFEEHHLNDLLRTDNTVIPAVNQIEFNPMQQQKRLMEKCQSSGIIVQGYCPFGKGHCLQNEVICTIARKHEISPAQVLILWSLHCKISCIPKSNNVTHIRDNVSIVASSGRVLDVDDISKLSALDAGLRVTWDPTHVL
eukprot:GSMAST32.ASY1.ANO1.2146.1 assembled CDS